MAKPIEGHVLAAHPPNRDGASMMVAARIGNLLSALALPVWMGALLTSALLLFLIQPMFAKMALPLLGGSPGVWNTCMVFFQAMLLAGYLYAHLLTSRFSFRWQWLIHSMVLALPVAFLPIALAPGWTPPPDRDPAPWLLMLLTVSVGIPFFVVSTTNPLLQSWFSGTDHPSAKDPYFLYAASNVGSLAALLAYPLLIEPSFTLRGQREGWAWGFGALVVLVACAGFWRDRHAAVVPNFPSLEGSPSAVESLTWSRRLRWIALAFVPSSLMLGVTTYLTTDIASIPLLWILPLSLYLLTFILVFAKKPLINHDWMTGALPWLALPLAVLMISTVTRELLFVVVGLHLAAFFVSAMVCHGELSLDRPSARHLTEFYLLLSLGGVLGGLFNAILAPLLFSSIAEYPLALVLACLFRPLHAPSTLRQRRLDYLLPALLGVVVFLLIGLFLRGKEDVPLLVKLGVFVAPALACFSFKDRPVRFALGLGTIPLGCSLLGAFHGTILHSERSFYGVHRVTVDPRGFYVLEHGTTQHGRQAIASERRRQPLSYYHPSGPLGEIFSTLGKPDRATRIAVVGLGSGALAAYGQPAQQMIFFEIDPAVPRLAQSQWFSYLADSRADCQVVLGDGRLRLAEAPDASFGLILLDAFSSDSVPTHLLTVEATRLYLSKLSDHGVLGFHISNRYLDLAPALSAVARDLGLVFLARDDDDLSFDERQAGKEPSRAAVMARTKGDLEGLGPGWRPIAIGERDRAWTDDWSNFLATLKRSCAKASAAPYSNRQAPSRGRGAFAKPLAPGKAREKSNGLTQETLPNPSPPDETHQDNSSRLGEEGAHSDTPRLRED